MNLRVSRNESRPSAAGPVKVGWGIGSWICSDKKSDDKGGRTLNESVFTSSQLGLSAIM